MKIYDIINEGAEDFSGTYSPEAISLGKKFCDHYNITDRDDVQLVVELIDNFMDESKSTGEPFDIKRVKSEITKAFRQVYRGMGPGPSFRKSFNGEGVAEGGHDIMVKHPQYGSEWEHATKMDGKKKHTYSSKERANAVAKNLMKGSSSQYAVAKSVKEQGVAEGEYDDPRFEPREPDMSRKVDWDIEAERNQRGTEEESDKIVYIIDDNTDKVVLKFKSTGGYYGDVRHAAKHGYDTEGGDYSIKWKRAEVNETATAGATSAGNVAVGAVYKNKPAKQAKNKDGTAKNALDMKANLLTGGSIKR